MSFPNPQGQRFVTAQSRATPLCPSCGKELKTHFERSENICDRLACRGPWLQAQAKIAQTKAEAERRKVEAAVDEQLRDSCPDLLAHEPPLLRIIVPNFEDDLAPQSDERRQAFRKELAERFAAAKKLIADPAMSDRILAEHEPQYAKPSAPYIVNACCTCRGSCCRPGHDFALLQPEFLAWRLLTEPDQTAVELIDDYMDRIPPESLNESCFYHTPEGCQLPREIRSPTCNEFLCAGIRNELDELLEAPNQPTLAVAVDTFDTYDCVRVGIMDTDGNRSERTVQ